MSERWCVHHVWLIWQRGMTRGKLRVRVRCGLCDKKATWPASAAQQAAGEWVYWLAQQRRLADRRRAPGP